VKAFGRIQTLYAIDENAGLDQLAGVAMFVRENRTSMVVLHLAAHEDYTANGPWADACVVTRLLSSIRHAASCTHGVETLRMVYPHKVRIDLRRRHPNRAAR